MILATKAEDRKVFDCSAESAYAALLSVLEKKNGFSIKSQDDSAKTIEAKTGVSMRAFGENISIRVTPNGADSCDVWVYSELAVPALSDSGKNKANVMKVMDLLASALRHTDGPQPIYHVDGYCGKTLDVYEDKCVITSRATIGSFMTGNMTDGEKTIYYTDCIGVQFKRNGAGVTVGYLQLETSSGMMNKKGSNFWSENSFTFNKDSLNAQMAEIADYIKDRIDAIKRQKSAPQTTTVIQQAAAPSAADELKKFKELLDMGAISQEEYDELLDMGAISQEEYDAKKKQLLGL